MVDNNFNNMKVLAKCQMDVHIGHNAFAGTLHEHNICNVVCAVLITRPPSCLCLSMDPPWEEINPQTKSNVFQPADRWADSVERPCMPSHLTVEPVFSLRRPVHAHNQLSCCSVPCSDPGPHYYLVAMTTEVVLLQQLNGSTPMYSK